MEEHPLFNHIKTIEEGKYRGILNGTEYSLHLVNLRNTFPQINISYNDIRSCWILSGDESFEKDGEAITYDRRTGDLSYSRFKEHVSSLVNPSFNFPMDISDKFKMPYPKHLEQLLDTTLELLKTAQKLKD